jgi:hypothetical protein
MAILSPTHWGNSRQSGRKPLVQIQGEGAQFGKGDDEEIKSLSENAIAPSPPPPLPLNAATGTVKPSPLTPLPEGEETLTPSP